MASRAAVDDRFPVMAVGTSTILADQNVVLHHRQLAKHSLTGATALLV